MGTYIKKPIFGPSITEVYNTTFEDNKKDVETKDDCQMD